VKRSFGTIGILAVMALGCDAATGGADPGTQADADAQVETLQDLPPGDAAADPAGDPGPDEAIADVPAELPPDVAPPACCDSDADCPAHQVCTKYGTCQDEPAAGRCWKDADCYMSQTCVGATDCDCGKECAQITISGTCEPVPAGCCYADADCGDGEVCRGGYAPENGPGQCVPSHLGPECLGDAACCWDDGDCPGGWCEGAYACGCVELCPMCGACAGPTMGYCKTFTVAATATLVSGQCKTEPETHPAFSWYLVKLTWTTTEPAKSTIALGLNEFTGLEGGILVEEGFVTEHAMEFSVSHMHFGAVPKAGDTLLFRIDVTTADGGKGQSNVIQIPVDQALRDCLYPYDKACSDGEAIWCRALPPPCDEGLVMAAIDNCQRCVFAATCTCDDGEPAICPSAPPQCESPLIMATQDGCFACVNPFTCRPPA
jgi:hypothetical protein